MRETTETNAAGAGRRRLLQGGAVATAATLAMPGVSRAQTAVWKFQSTWPTKDIFHEVANDFARRVNEMAGGRLRLDVLPAGAIVPAFQVLDSISAGVIDGGHSVAAYWYGKNKAFSLFGTPPPFGWNANGFLGWVNYGGGQELYNELIQQVLRLNVTGFLSGPIPSQPLGWFKREIKGPEDLRGLKYRTVGLAADLYREMGVAVTIVAGAEIVPALERGVIDGAEFSNPSSDLALGFPDVSKTYMMRSYHQSAESFELLFNKAKYDALAPEQRAILKYAGESSSSDFSWKLLDRFSKDLDALRARGVNVLVTPDSILKAQLAAWTKVVERTSAENPFFKKVVDSQMAWVKRTAGYEQLNAPSAEAAYAHFFRG